MDHEIDAPPHQPAHQGSISVLAMTPFVRLVYGAGDAVVERGAAPFAALLRRWGISVTRIQAEPRLRLPTAMMVELHALCEQLLPGRPVALEAALGKHPQDFELLDLLGRSAATLGEAVDCITCYHRLIADSEGELRVQAQHAELLLRFAPAPHMEALYEFALLSVAVSLRAVVDADAQPIVAIQLMHTGSAEQAAIYSAALGAKVHFDADAYAVVLDSNSLRLPLATADSTLHGVLRRQARHELEHLPRQTALPHTVQETLGSDLSQGADLLHVAKQLGMSTSSLRQKLRAHGTTFTEVLDDHRRERARHLLAATDLSMSEVASALGFAHPTALNRATRRWFGIAPSAYRVAQRRHPLSGFLRGR